MNVISPITQLTPEIHTKAWGHETWLVNNELYCAKILTFESGKRFSLHYHWEKTETWYVVAGELELLTIDLATATRKVQVLRPGDVIHVPAGNPHQLVALTDAEVFEVSTTHRNEDSYRIAPGNSQQ